MSFSGINSNSRYRLRKQIAKYATHSLSSPCSCCFVSAQLAVIVFLKKTTRRKTGTKSGLLNSFVISAPADILEEDLIVFFTLSIHNKGLLFNRRGDHNRLGFALQLCTERYLGYCHDDFVYIPQTTVTSYLAKQLNITSHLALILQLGQREMIPEPAIPKKLLSLRDRPRRNKPFFGLNNLKYIKKVNC